MLVKLSVPDFIPHPAIRHRHVMTIAASLWPRSFSPAVSQGRERLFEVEPGTRLLGKCHWQKDRAKATTLLILHGLEGSSESHYILGLTQKALAYGMNVVRLNMRNCGGTLHLTPTLYNAGLSHDPLAVAKELKAKDGIENIVLVGFSIGGNIVLKAAAELGVAGSTILAGVCAVSPSVDLAPCLDALESGFNKFYEQRFLAGLKAKLKEKQRLFPEIYDTTKLTAVRRLREFDGLYTAPHGGYGTAENYYQAASALPFLDRLSVPTLIVHAQDDPFVPFGSLGSRKLENNRCINLLSPEHGGHAAFIHKDQEAPPLLDRFWAENRVITFCLEVNALSA